jgi:hypothetical protein
MREQRNEVLHHLLGWREKVGGRNCDRIGCNIKLEL